PLKEKARGVAAHAHARRIGVGHAFAADNSGASNSFASRLSIDMDGVLQTLLSELENRPSPRPSPRTSEAREIIACRAQVGARAARIGAAVRWAQRGSEESTPDDWPIAFYAIV